MGDFATATRVEGADGRYRAHLDPEWFAWGPFGGYLAALAIRAVGAASALPWPATFSGMFLAVGKAGPIDIRVDVIKRGKRAEALRATVAQEGTALFEASLWMVDRELTGLHHDHARMPEVPPLRGLRSYAELDDNYDKWSAFWRYLEGRPVEWYHPDRRPPPNPRWHTWLRMRSGALPDTPSMRAAAAAMWLDLPIWGAAALVHPWPLTHIAPSLDLTVQFRSALYEQPEARDWVLAEGFCPSASAGLVGGTGNLWDPGGCLLAVCTSQMLCRPNPNLEAEQAEIDRLRTLVYPE